MGSGNDEMCTRGTVQLPQNGQHDLREVTHIPRASINPSSITRSSVICSSQWKLERRDDPIDQLNPELFNPCPMRQVMRMVIDLLVFILYLHSDIKLEVNDLKQKSWSTRRLCSK